MQKSADPAEVAKFEAIAREWWDPNGKFKPLHNMNPIRLAYICEQIAWHFERDLKSGLPFEGISILDIGCGGGLLCEPLTRLGAKVKGIDAAPTNIEVAQLHAQSSGLDIDYQNILAEDLDERFDVILAMEIVEHVVSPQDFLNTIHGLMHDESLMVMSTLNRNPKSYLGAIIGAEYVLRWLPKGTHDWNKFIKPDELADMIETSGLRVKDRRGMVLNPLTQNWSLSHKDLSINYVMASVKS